MAEQEIHIREQATTTTSTTTPVAENLKGVSEGISRLVRDHVELAKVELQTSAKRMARDAGITAAGAAMLAVGYLLLMFAIGYAIGDAIGLARGFLIIAGFHVIVGFALVAVFAQRLKGKDKPSMQMTTAELEKDKRFLDRVNHIVREEARP